MYLAPTVYERSFPGILEEWEAIALRIRTAPGRPPPRGVDHDHFRDGKSEKMT
jgi:hypothetical protein